MNKTTLYHAFTVLLAAASLFNAISGVRTGAVMVPWYRGNVKKADDPVMFWFAVALSVVVSVGLFLSLITGDLD